MSKWVVIVAPIRRCVSFLFFEEFHTEFTRGYRGEQAKRFWGALPPCFAKTKRSPDATQKIKHRQGDQTNTEQINCLCGVSAII
jgi:hypothetical protein